MTERQRADELRRRVLQEARLGLAVPHVSGSFAELLADVLLELSRLAEIVDAAREAVGSTP